MNANLNQRMRNVLYMLKRQYGGRIDLYKKGAASSNPRTGERTIEKSVIPIKRAIILPAEVARQVIQGISLISANKSLVQGGGYDNALRLFIIEKRDVPSDLSLTPDDWIVFKRMKYQISEFREFEFDTCWVITAKALLGEVPQQIHLLSADNLLSLSSSVAEE